MTTDEPAHAEREVTLPKGWTNKVPAKQRVESMLKDSTSLSNVQVDLVQKNSTQYLFHSGTKYYFWNSATEDGGEVTSPLKYQDLLTQMGKDIRKVQAKAFPRSD